MKNILFSGLLSLLVICFFFFVPTVHADTYWGAGAVNDIYNLNTGKVAIGASNSGQLELFSVIGSSSGFSNQYLFGLYPKNQSQPLLDVVSTDYDVKLDLFQIAGPPTRIIRLSSNGSSWLNGAGGVGIGTTNPAARLDIDGLSADSLRIVNTDQTPNAVVINNRTFGTTDSTGFALWQSNNGAANIGVNGGTRLTISSSGNIGIGSIAPTSPLDITYTNSGTFGGFGGGTGQALRLQNLNSNVASTTLAMFPNSGGSDFDIMIWGSGTYSPNRVILDQRNNAPLSIFTSDTERFTVLGNGYIGVGTAAPNEKLEVNGGVRLNTTAGKPTCDVNKRGDLWFTQSGSGTKDSLEVCAKDSSDSYSWRIIY